MKTWFWLLALIAGFAFLSAFGCGDDDDDDSGGGQDDDDNDDDDDDDDDNNDDNDDNDDNDNDDAYWDPSQVVPIDAYGELRGYDVIRGIIHLHSVYSHDGCDSMPFINGHPNWRCFDQLREAFCTTNQQYIMLTDHADLFAYYDFPEVLLYSSEDGDELIYKDSDPIANVIHCDDGNDTVLMSGSENDLMPIAIERMPEGTGDERDAFFSRRDAEVVDAMHDLGGLLFVNHAEQWTTDDLLALPIDGIEVYNLHANIDPGGIAAPSLAQVILNVLNFLFPLSEAGQSDLILLAFFMENAPDILHWDTMLDQRRTVGLIATDAHRNSLPFPLPDGDRADSYRRMMKWFANYILVNDRDPDTIKEAIGNGRMWGAFQVFGEPVGFEFYADTGKATYEMGDEVLLSDGPTLTVRKPAFWNMDPSLPEPEFKLAIVKAAAGGGQVMEEGTNEDLTFTPTEPGAYRAQVHVIPNHLEQWLGDNAAMFIKEYPLIYANAIYVVE